MTKNIFNWNHISSNLTQDQITELKEYYQTYHRKCWAFKQAAKRFKKWKLLGDTLSVVCNWWYRVSNSNLWYISCCYINDLSNHSRLDETQKS